MSKATKQPPTEIRGLLFFSEFMTALMAALKDGRTVNNYVFDKTGDCPIEIEVHVKKIGGQKLPRVSQP